MTAPLSPERWRRVSELFHLALDVAQADRAAWLDGQCGDDADVRREVESLLHADDDPQSDSAIAHAVDEAVVDAAATRAGMSERIGNYRILKEIGQGGMGTVFLGVREDADFDQRVAIKVVRGALGGESLRRFRAERKILATLQHASIARMIDGGTTEDGVPYLVMEYVEGVPIDEYCAKKNLSVIDRLELFCRVCDGVNHAHQSFVVHRDIKPSNILVTEDGTPKLLDFGIAKLLDDDLTGDAPITVTGFRALTPDYASPEQVRGQPITTASDVYSLGVLLYEILTGRRPLTFKTRQPQEIVLVVCTEEPRKPSTVVGPGRSSRELAGDLDTITLTALSKEPARRYATAAALAEDIRRHVAGMPVHARPATWRYRSTRFLRRHPTGVTVAAVFALVIIGLGVALVRQARDLASQRDTAEQVTNLLLEMYSSFDPSGAAGGEMTALDVLENGAARIQREFGAQPALQARLLDAVGTLYGSIAQPARADAMLRQSLALRETLGPDTLATAATLTRLADALRNQGRFLEAEPPARRALEIDLRLAGPDALETAEARNILGIIVTLRGRPIEGATLMGEAVETWRREKGADSPEFSNGVTNLLRSWRERGDYPKAERFERADLLRVERFERERLASRRRSFGEPHLTTSDSLLSVSRLLSVMGRNSEAEPFARDAVAVRTAVLGPSHLSVAEAQHNLAVVMQDQGRLVEAEPLYRSALAMLSRDVPNHPQRPVYFTNIASLLEESGRLEEAEQLLRDALDLRKSLQGRERVALARTQRALAGVLLKRQRVADARALADEALAICRTELGEQDPETQIARQFQKTVLSAGQ